MASGLALRAYLRLLAVCEPGEMTLNNYPASSAPGMAVFDLDLAMLFNKYMIIKTKCYKLMAELFRISLILALMDPFTARLPKRVVGPEWHSLEDPGPSTVE